jgi:chromosome segregation protein
VKLKRLIIHGFKSFKDRTIIHFDDGITGIVGPNGCGKSNIVDALFWVMGEQSAKHLRGNSMKDVIFAGSSKYSPGAWTEVSLVLENTNGKHIHIGNQVVSPQEIMLTRKLYRNGETEYRINEAPCRLKDIQEVFMDTGAGAKSYSIIAQGEINRLVQAKPEERRSMIEEVAGITKFKMRRKESLKKIEMAHQNLSRLQDLKTEVEKQLKSLEKQAEKAEKARSLRDKIKRYDLSVSAHKVFDFLKTIAESGTRRRELEDLGAELSTAKAEIEASMEGELHKKEELTEQLDLLQSDYNQISRELAAKEERLQHLQKSLIDKHKIKEAREKEIQELTLELTEKELKKAEWEKQRDELEQKNNEDQDFSFLEDRVADLKDEYDDASDELSGWSEKERELGIQKGQLEQDLFRHESKLQDHAKMLEDINEEIEGLEKQYSVDNERLLELKKKSDQLVIQFTKQQELVQSETSQVEQLKISLKDETKKREEIHREVARLEGEKETLFHILSSTEKLKKGTVHLLEEHADLFKQLKQQVAPRAGFEKVTERILIDVLDYPYLDSEKASSLERSDFTKWLEEQSGSVDFLKQATFSVQESEENTLSDFLSRVAVRLNLKEKDIMPLQDCLENQVSWAKGHYVLDVKSDEREVSLVSSLAKLFDENFKVPPTFLSLTTKCGDYRLLMRGGLVHFSSFKGEENGLGMLEKKARLEELRPLIEEKELLRSSLDESLTKIEADLFASEEKLSKLRNELFSLQSEKTQAESQYLGEKKGHEGGNVRLEILKKRKIETSASRLDLITEVDKVQRLVQERRGALSDISERRELAQERFSELEEQYEMAREELTEKQVFIRTFRDKVQSVQRSLDDLDQSIAKIIVKKEQYSEQVESLYVEAETIDRDLNTLRDENMGLKDELSHKEDILGILRDELAQLLVSMQERDQKLKEINKKLVAGEKELVELEVKLKHAFEEEVQVTRDIIERYQINLRESLRAHVQLLKNDEDLLSDISLVLIQETVDGPKAIKCESYDFSRKYGQELKETHVKLKDAKTEFLRLGEINWQAIEDYDRQKIRHQFLEDQEGELKKSLTDLELAIKQIDEKCLIRFKGAFEEVNSRFEKVFPIIFGGGSAELKLTGDINGPEAGVDIVAQPPGKKMQNINLMSGGEKAMTAVSLIFSIFLVKPSPFCLLDEVDAPLDDANVGRFNELLREMSDESQFILITHNKKTMELNDTLYGVTMQEPGISKAVSVQLH